MRYLPINKSFFIQNRAEFCRKLKPNSIAIFLSHDIYPTNADATFPFKQNNDLFYLSGIDQEDTILLLFPGAIDQQHQCILFIRETSPHIAIWEGEKLTQDQASLLSGIDTIYWEKDFETMLEVLLAQASTIYINNNEHGRAEKKIKNREERFGEALKTKHPSHLFERSAPLMHELRVIKKQKEIDQVIKACSITEGAFDRVLKFTKPGVFEFEIEAEVAHEFLMNRSSGPAYASIIASGKDACVLHYITNNKVCQSGDLILMDFGAAYGNYASDMTRTIPVNGKFTARQKEVYQAVLTILKASTALLYPGNTFENYQKEVNLMVEAQLIKIGLLNQEDVVAQDPKNPLFKKYFMHGISHFLGLDVHDVGERTGIMKEGMLLTCEPGIYIQEEGLGIRLENNILITSNGPLDLMSSIPIEIEDIENKMNKSK